MTPDEKRLRVVKTAQSLIGKPYKYGAKMSDAPNFFDCSGFVKYVFGQVGIELPRSTIEQAEDGEEVSQEELIAGDLLFTRGARGHYSPEFPEGIGHVGIYDGSREVIHATSKRVQKRPKIIEKGGVEKTSLDEFLKKGKKLIVIKRIIR